LPFTTARSTKSELHPMKAAIWKATTMVSVAARPSGAKRRPAAANAATRPAGAASSTFTTIDGA
jgi:hypothetical protein